MSKQKYLQIIEDSGIIAVIRLSDVAKLEKIIGALASGGIKALEITMTTPNAVEIIQDLAKKLDDEFILGAGTVLDAETAETVIRAGAKFIVSPIMEPDVIKMTQKYDMVSIPGAFSPTEIVSAWNYGADIVKIFPATALGPGFFKDIRGPLPHIKLTPTGGVSLDNAAQFIQAGASCIGVGTSLLNKKMIAEENWDGLSRLAADFIKQVRKGRGLPD